MRFLDWKYCIFTVCNSKFRLSVLGKKVFFHYFVLKCNDTVGKILACIIIELRRRVFQSKFSLNKCVVTLFMYRLLVLRPSSPSHLQARVDQNLMFVYRDFPAFNVC
jgi:hypothetical protein